MKKEIRLGEIVQFSLGKNLSRMDIDSDNVYSIEDFNNDLYGKTTENSMSMNKNMAGTLSVGDCIVSLTKSQAVIVSEYSCGKYISTNFLKCSFDKKEISPWFLCYLINEDAEVSKQIKMNKQASNGFVTKLNSSTIAELVVSLPEIELQNQIGEMYRLILLQERLRIEQTSNWKILNMELLKKIRNS